MSYELIFSSWSASSLDPGRIPAIVKHARIKNRRYGITGLMAYDGAQFCQLLEGAPTAVDWMASVISNDHRHSRFTVLHAGKQEGPRRFPACSMAFALYDGYSLAETIALHPGRQMADYLQATPASRIDCGD